jgi:hypothetical protein
MLNINVRYGVPSSANGAAFPIMSFGKLLLAQMNSSPRYTKKGVNSAHCTLVCTYMPADSAITTIHVYIDDVDFFIYISYYVAFFLGGWNTRQQDVWLGQSLYICQRSLSKLVSDGESDNEVTVATLFTRQFQYVDSASDGGSAVSRIRNKSIGLTFTFLYPVQSPYFCFMHRDCLFSLLLVAISKALSLQVKP